MSARRAATLGLALVGLAVAVATTGFAAFSSTTGNAGDSFAAGTVVIADNDAGAAMLSLSGARPGDSDTSCIRVTYTGTLDAGVRLHGSVTGTLAPYLSLVVTRGTDAAPTFDSCTAFTPDATNYLGAGPGVVYSGTLAAFPASYAAGLTDPTAGSPETWSTGEAHSYKFTVTLQNDAAAQGQSASASFVWEARNL